MNAKIELYSSDLLVQLDQEEANPYLCPASSAVLHCLDGEVIEVGPAHATQKDPVKAGNRVLICAEKSRFLLVNGKKCALVAIEGLVWRKEK